jgi:hypothetical protein
MAGERRLGPTEYKRTPGARSAGRCSRDGGPPQRAAALIAVPLSLPFSVNLPHFNQNPFFILQATPRDDRRRLLELAEARGLQFESGVCDRARADLTNPRIRLAAEIAWLPGISPSRGAALIDLLRSAPQSIRGETGLPPLARANLLAAVWREFARGASAEAIAEFILETDAVVGDISAAAVICDINKDRTVSGFPPVQAIALVESGLAQRVRDLRALIESALDALPSASIIGVLRAAAAAANGQGRHASALLDGLVDSYEISIRTVMEREAALACQLMDLIRSKLVGGSGALEPILRSLEEVARNWGRLAQPLQLSCEARGLDHKASLDLGNAIIRLSVEAWNQHRMLDLATRLNDLGREIFAEVPQLAERLQLDQATFANIAQKINYSGTVGRLFKRRLSISAAGVRWHRKHYPIESIARIRWGAVTYSGIFRKSTRYTIGFGDAREESCLETSNETLYLSFTEGLWYSAGVRLLAEFCEILKAGGQIRFGNTRFRDDGVDFVQWRPFGPNQVHRCAWDQVIMNVRSGTLTLRAKHNPAVWAWFNFRIGPNVHVLAKALELVLTPPFKQRMSELLTTGAV